MKTHSLTLTTKTSTVTLVVLGLALFFGCPQGAVAQTNALNSTGNAGVGTTSPGQLLQINSPAATQSLIAFSVNTDPHALWGVSGSTNNIISGSALGDSVFRSTNKNILFSTDAGSSAQLYLKNGGNVGIGTTSPGSILDIRAPEPFVNIQATTGIYRAFQTFNNTGGQAYLGLDNSSGNGMYSSGGAAYSFSFVGAGANPIKFGHTNAEVTILSGGNVGIGTTSPGKPLTVQAGSAANAIAINGRSDDYGYLEFFRNNGTTLAGAIYSKTDRLTITDAAATDVLTVKTGNVGIGTTSPGKPLTVQAGSAANAIAINGRSDDYGYLEFFRNNGTTLAGAIYSKTDRLTLTDGAATDVLTVKSGKVGIGITTPTAALDVVGDIKLSGSINAKYQDVAEWVPSSEQLPTGTVVVLDSTKSNQVIHSTQAYDTRVAGVISEKPGIALGESGANKVLVATTGRVLVNVDASKGAIHAGDLLVTSDTPGMAMKSTPVSLSGIQLHRPGTLLGKALEPMEKGSGRILVLLSLQ